MANMSSLNTTNLADEGVWMEVEDAEGEPFLDDGGNIVRIKLLGSTSKVVRQRRRKNEAATIQNIQKRRKLSENDIAKSERDNLEIAIAATLAWEGVELDGENLECTPANVRKVYSVADVLLDQVKDYINDTSRFTKASSKN